MGTRVAGGLSHRDYQVVELVARFRQMTRGHIRASLFTDVASGTPVDRTLKRLMERHYLTRLARLVGGDHGGSAQFVYQLGRIGWKLLDKPGAYWAPRAVNLHALAVGDCYAALKRAEHRGQIEVIQFTTEPECHQTVGNVLLTPDAYVEIGNRAEQVKYACWLEVDRGTEHLGVIREKCERYWRAYTRWPQSHFPSVVFVVPDVRRVQEIKEVISAGPADARQLFRCCTLPELVGVTAARQ